MSLGVAVSLVIPFREEGNRKLLLDTVLEYYMEFIDSVKVNVIISDANPSREFNRAQSRNFGVQKALDFGSKVVVVNDADTIAEYRNIVSGIELAIKDGVCVLPYSECYSLTGFGTWLYRKSLQRLGVRFSRMSQKTCGGIWIMETKNWIDLGGQDSEFNSWGSEDVAFYHAYKVIKGEPMRRLQGKIITLEHRGTANRIENLDSKNLVSSYLEIQDAQMMRKFVNRIR